MERPTTRLVKYLGKDKHGFRYFGGLDLYVYQQYPCDRPYFVSGRDMRGKYNGWICNWPSWSRILNRLAA